MKQRLPYILSIATFLIVWEVLAALIDYPDIFPDIISLFRELGQLFIQPEFYSSLLFTILRGFIGFFIACLLALLLSGISVYSSFFRAYFRPAIVVSRSIPVISLVLIALLWFSSDELPVFIALFTMFPILYQYMLNGFDATDKRWVEMAKVSGKNRLQIWRQVYLPASHELIFSGISVAFGFGWRAVIIGEALSQPLHGIGAGMKQAQAFINMPALIAWTVMAILVSALFEWLIGCIKSISRSVHVPAVVHSYAKPSASELEISIITNQLEKLYETVRIQYTDAYFQKGNIYCLKSPSGSGKTTFLRILSGLEMQDRGEIISTNVENVGYSFQDARLLPWLTVQQNIFFVLSGHRNYSKTELMHRFSSMVEMLGLSDCLTKYPAELSGGQQQRVALARALVLPCDLLLLDEPLNGLDASLKLKTIAVIEQYVAEFKPLVVWATHEDISMSTVTITEVQIC
jgi:ABC-type nitrate/sulfonate/bicarbonate transport system permease component/ABC-type nitrate/sulfonate/bicarbonate transport system ATPase subunit